MTTTVTAWMPPMNQVNKFIFLSAPLFYSRYYGHECKILALPLQGEMSPCGHPSRSCCCRKTSTCVYGPRSSPVSIGEVFVLRAADHWVARLIWPQHNSWADARVLSAESRMLALANCSNLSDRSVLTGGVVFSPVVQDVIIPSLFSSAFETGLNILNLCFFSPAEFRRGYTVSSDFTVYYQDHC